MSIGRPDDLFVTPREYFFDLVNEGVKRVSFKPTELSQSYLVGLLEQFVSSSKLFEFDEVSGQKSHGTLAEMFLKATNSEKGIRVDLLKRLGDTSLYISGFFGDSLNRKLVDIDYYRDMGGAAYGSLSKAIKDESFQQVYEEFSIEFMGFVDLLTFISQKAYVQTNEDLLRVYEKFIKTGSEAAKEHLLEKGIIASEETKKTKKYSQ